MKLQKSKLKFLVLVGILSSCLHTEPPSNQISLLAEKEEVWKTLVKVLKSYPLKTIDNTSGYIETKIIKGPNIWRPPNKTRKDFYGYSYKIIAKLSYSPPLSTVIIEKKVHKQQGFLSEKKLVPSNLLEEQALIYEISREIELQNLLNKADF